jgi:hypothetical protein
MKILTEKNHLTSLTLLHLEGWLEALAHLIGTEDWPFATTDELAMQLEYWRHEYQLHNSNLIQVKEEIKVMIYGDEVILLCKEVTGEFIKLTLQDLCEPNTAIS